MSDSAIIDRVPAELRGGMALAKCRQCGCMKDALLGIQAALAVPGMAGDRELEGQFDGWLGEMRPIKYACLGCDYCYAGAATNLWAQAFPDAADPMALTCTFEVRPGT